jgi:hypothetical protein
MNYKKENHLYVIRYGDWFKSYFAIDYKDATSANDVTVINTRNLQLAIIASPLAMWKWNRWRFEVLTTVSRIKYVFMLPSCIVSYLIKLNE